MESLKIGKWMQKHLRPAQLPGWALLVNRLVADYGLEKIKHLPQHQFIEVENRFRLRIPSLSCRGQWILYSMGTHTGGSQDGLRHLIPFVDWSKTFVNDPLSYESDRSLQNRRGDDLRFPAVCGPIWFKTPA